LSQKDINKIPPGAPREPKFAEIKAYHTWATFGKERNPENDHSGTFIKLGGNSFLPSSDKGKLSWVEPVIIL
jgi:hypothetical protein